MLSRCKALYFKHKEIVKEFDRKSERNKSIIYYSVYSLIFIFTAAVAFSWFWRNDKSFIWHYDGLYQHYSILTYYGMYLRDIVREFFSTGTLSIPMWDFSIGHGADILTTLHYYVIGDPLALLSIFVPASKTELLYNFLVILRFFLAGVTFSIYCRGMGKGRFATLCGALVYIFCSYALQFGMRHPYFMNPMIYLPLIFLGIERIFAGKKPYLFIFMVFLSLASNFYFFYMLSVFMFLYAAIRFFFIFPENRIKKLVINLRNFIGYYFVGLLMACAIFVPILIAFLSTERAGADNVVNLLYPLRYYSLLLSSFIAGHGSGYSTYIGASPIALVAVILLFRRKNENTQLKIGFILLSLFLLTPFMGHIFNGFSYVTNRWTWAYAFVVALIIVVMMPSILAVVKKRTFVVPAFACVYLAACLLVGNHRNIAAFLLPLPFIFSTNIYHGQRQKIKQKFERLFPERIYIYWETISRYVPKFAVIAIIILGIVVQARFKYAISVGNYVDEFMESGESHELYMNSTAGAVKKIDDDSFFRYEENASGGQRVIRNAALLNQVNSTSFYYSLSNGHIARFLQEVGFSTRDYQYTGLDNRTLPTVLASTKYYVIDSGLEQYLPYGYNELVSSSGDFDVYENDYALPLGYTYSNVTMRKDYEEMSFIERQQAMLQGAVIEGNSTSLKTIQPTFSDRNIPYEMEISDGIEYSNGELIVNDTSATVTLSFEGVENSKTYLSFENIHFTPMNPLDKYSEESWSELSFYQQSTLRLNNLGWQGADTAKIKAKSGNFSKIARLRTPDYAWYSGQHDFIVNLGYGEEAKSTMTLTFDQKGTYTFDSIDIICQPMEYYGQQIEALKEDVLENVNVDTNTVSGTISLEENKLLALSIPYSNGWSAYVNGEEVALLNVNTMYMGIYLEPGSHEILLTYTTPGLNIGIALSLSGVTLFIGIIFFHHRKTKGNQN